MTKTKAWELNSVLIPSVVTLTRHCQVQRVLSLITKCSDTTQRGCPEPRHPRVSLAALRAASTKPSPLPPSPAAAQLYHGTGTSAAQSLKQNKTEHPNSVRSGKDIQNLQKMLHFQTPYHARGGRIQNSVKFCGKETHLSSWSKLSAWQRGSGMEEATNIDRQKIPTHRLSTCLVPFLPWCSDLPCLSSPRMRKKHSGSSIPRL